MHNGKLVKSTRCLFAGTRQGDELRIEAKVQTPILQIVFVAVPLFSNRSRIM